MNNETRQLWTPTITAGVPGDLSVTYNPTTRLGYWAQSGSLVTIGCALTFSPTYTTASSSLLLVGVPPSLAPDGISAVAWGTGVYLTGGVGWTWPAGQTSVSVGWNGTTITNPDTGQRSGALFFVYSGSNVTAATARITDIASGSANVRINFTLTYALAGA